MGSRILFLGIDGMDGAVMQRLLGSMPSLAGFIQRAVNVDLVSTFPPDSDTAWASVYTGLNPAKHGVVRFVDPLEKVQKIQTKLVDNSPLRGNTFWDLAGDAGKRVCVLFPHMGYPVWSVNGVMTARSPVTGDVQVYAPGLAVADLDILAGQTPRGFPGRRAYQVRGFIDQLRQATVRDAEMGLELLREQEWDLFFAYWSTLDAVQHYFWDHHDEDAPGFQRNSPYRDVIRAFYRLFDEVIGWFLDEVSDDTAVIIMSDHGHGMRPQRLFNVNELLRRQGFLVPAYSAGRRDGYPRERLKRKVIELVSRYRLGRFAGRAMRMFPGVTQSFTKPSSVDWGETTAYATDMSGIKAYSYGGIHVRKNGIPAAEYEGVRDRIIDLVQERCVTEDGESLLKFIARREELYEGPHLCAYPDIVLELKYGWGIGQSIGNALFGRSPVTSLMPGSHRRETPILLIRTGGRRSPNRRDVHMMDIAPTVLDLLGLCRVEDLDGMSIYQSDSRDRSSCDEDLGRRMGRGSI